MIMIEASGGSSLCNINNNIIGNGTANNISGGANLTGISLLPAGSVTATGNAIGGLSSNGVGAVTVTGMLSSVPTGTLTGNTIQKLTSAGAGASVQGFNILSGTAVTVSLNTINDLTATGTGNVLVNGISVNGGNTIALVKNKIHSLAATQSTGGGAALVNGIKITSGSAVTVQNNFISKLEAPVVNAQDAINGIQLTSTQASSNYQMYFNSISLAAVSSGANFGSNAISFTGSSTASTANLDLRNNIFDNESVSTGTGITVALRNMNTNLSNYATTSNNNMYFAGTLTVPGALYYDGTNNETGIGGLQTRLAPRESASIAAQPSFVSATDLHLLSSSNCGLDGGGAPVTGITDDIDGDSRNPVTPDIGADEFNGTGGGVGIWSGVNTNWLDPQNWCGQVPTSTMNVSIPGGKPFYPLITGIAPVTKNVSIAAGGTVTLTGMGKLTIYGSMSNAGIFNVSDGTIELAGSTSQSIPAGIFENNNIKNLIISNTSASPSVSLNGPLNLTGKLSFTGNNKTFASNDFLTLKSTAAGTASVGDLSSNSVANNNNQVTGNVQIERYISARRAWRFLAVPTKNNLQLIHEAWQENQPTGAPFPAGLGTQITSPLANWNALGFDMQSPGGPSVKVYEPASNGWLGIPTTLEPFVPGVGYMTFIRGDRTITTVGPPANSTVLREKGALNTYDFTMPVVGAGLFGAIGNPYASAVDFAKLGRSNLQDVYYMWDPQLGLFGGYVTFTGPTYTPTASISYNGGNHYIESGQAFFVHATSAAGTVTFKESSKVDGSNLVTRVIDNASRLQTKLYVRTADTVHLFDGVINEFDVSYSNNIDNLDALKLVNFGENLGIRKNAVTLSVERRSPVVSTDTIYYNLNQMRQQPYRLVFEPVNMAGGLTGYLEDLYLRTSTPVSMLVASAIDFTVNADPASAAADRFRLVFRQLAPVPVTFTQVRASKSGKDILVEWAVENQLNIDHYEVEKSSDGTNFSKVNEQASRGNNGASATYNWLDEDAWGGDNFYRIRSVGLGNDIKLSQVVKVNMPVIAGNISIYPNPVAADGIVHIQFYRQPAGIYQLHLLNNRGQRVMEKLLNHAGGNFLYELPAGKQLAHGSYLLNLIAPDDKKMTFKLLY